MNGRRFALICITWILAATANAAGSAPVPVTAKSFGCISQLRHPFWADETGCLNRLQASGRKAVDQRDLHLGWKQGLLVLQAIAGADFDDADMVGCSHLVLRSASEPHQHGIRLDELALGGVDALDGAGAGCLQG